MLKKSELDKNILIDKRNKNSIVYIKSIDLKYIFNADF